MKLYVWSFMLCIGFFWFLKIGTDSFIGCVQSGEEALTCTFDKTIR